MKPFVLAMLVAFAMLAANCAENTSQPNLTRESYRQRLLKREQSQNREQRERLENFVKIQNRVNTWQVQQRIQEHERQELVKRNLAHAKLLAELRLLNR